ncbi:eCIS core domain-containing protein [Streptomyces zaomyceticus]|uniref:eCIS core domain-containing protein n=1 Tax=Streptomyces zaomyceticus TaxID=68286 RepID=UPI0036826D2C
MTAGEHSTAASGLQGGGAPLEPGVRDQLSTSYGHDFSPVRVHVGPEADRATGELGALAYTVGNDVVFSHGAYDPLSRRGRSLIAHELAHVAQHGGAPGAPGFLRTDPSVAPPAADARLEDQAHTAAAFHGRGEPLPAGWSWERASGPFLGRADMSWTQLEDPYTVTYAGKQRTITEEQRSPGDPEDMVRVNMGAFVLPKTKGPWKDTYDAIAKEKGLQAVVNMSGSHPSSGLWEKRAPTTELRRLWLLRMQWPSDQATVWWQEAGGDAPVKGAEFNPRVDSVQSQIDHIVELQLGGTNVPDNLAPHDGPDNMNSGSTIGHEVQEAATSVSKQLHALGRKRPRQVILWFGSAEESSAYTKPVQPLPPPFTTRKAMTALQVHFTAEADLKEGRRPSAEDRRNAADAWAAYKDYPLVSGPSSYRLRVPEKPPADGRDEIQNSPVPENRAARELIAGVMLENLNRPSSGKSTHTVTAWIDDATDHAVRKGSRLPITIPDPKERQLTLDVKDPFTTGRLSLRGGKQEVHFLYPYLSRGRLTLATTEEGLAGRGTLTPSVPLLSRVPITVDWDRSGLRGAVQAPAEKLSLPPFKVTESALTLSLAPTFQAGGHVAFVLGSVVDGRIEAGADAHGLFAKGRIVGRIPGLDEATGDLAYRPATGLTGFFVARASRTSGLVRGGEVRLDVNGDVWRVGGWIQAVLPGESPAKLTVRRSGDRILYGGEATLKVPGLRPVDIALTYDGERVTGSARTTFALLGAEGAIALRYRDGNFSGDGSVELKRGRFAGRLDAHLDEDGRISGRGTGSLTIRPGLVGTVGVEYGRDRKLRVSGELRFPPYRFLEPRGARYELFRHSLPDIPIFAIPLGIGAVGLVARIGGGLAVHYRFGPGELRDMVIRGAFNPLEEEMNAELAAEARLAIPAEAGLEMFVRAGIGASVAIASATGGITLTGGVLLRGGLDASARLAYAKGVLTFDTLARISVQPVLTLRIEADIVIEAAVGGTWRFPYQLASYSYATGLEFGMIAPFHYQSDQPLRLPEARDIQWIVPQIDVTALANRVAGQVRTGLGF